MPITIVVSRGAVRYMVKEYLVSILVMEGLLIGVFIVADILLFYIVYEASILPMYMIIGIWGKRVEKVKAAYYILLYTVGGSILFLVGIAGLYTTTGVTDNGALGEIGQRRWLEIIVYIGIVGGMMVKIPVMPVHIWLPQAHVEAPLGGSIILAGVLLKIGGYGLIRYLWVIVPEAVDYYGPLVEMLALVGIVYGGLITSRQIDIKRAIAYASIGHMGLVVVGINRGNGIGEIGGIYMMVSHGLISAGLFIAAGVLYERYRTRLMRYYRGQWVTMPLYSIYLLLLIMGNAGMPISSGYIGEIQLLIGVYKDSAVMGIIGGIGGVIAAVYGFSIYSRVCYGQPGQYSKKMRDINRQENAVLLVIVLLVYVMGIWPWVITEGIVI